MKLFIAIAVVLAVLAFTQAQDDANQPEVSDAEEPQSDSEVQPSNPDEPLSDPEAPPSDEPRPQRPEGSGRPPRPEGLGRPSRPGRPDRHFLGHIIPRPQPNEDQPNGNESPEGNHHQRNPQRRPVHHHFIA